MERNVARAFEALLIVVVLASVGLGVTWIGGTQPIQPQPLPSPNRQGQAPLPLQLTQATQSPAQAILRVGATGTPEFISVATSVAPIALGTAAPTAKLVTAPTSDAATLTPGPNAQIIATPILINLGATAGQIEPGDAPLLEQAPGTVNILVLGTDAALSDHMARTDSIMIASINPAIPSVSLMSFPRDLLVKFPGGHVDRINTVSRPAIPTTFKAGGQRS